MIFVSIQKMIRVGVFASSVSLLFLFSGTGIVYAASLYITPSSGVYNVGQTFSAGVYVSSPEQTMNAASGIISFPSDKLQIVSLSKEGSVMNLWVQEPFFSNTAGTLSFEGVALNPGFNGLTGKILSATFKVKAVGAGTLAFTQGSILANDGLGTNILDNTTGANLSLQLSGSGSSVSAPSSSVGNVPNAPEVVSSTHPDENKWYSSTTAKFSWKLSSGTTGVRLLIDHKTETIPTVSYIPPIDSKTIDELENGVWYLHARLRNSAGWGKIAHFKVQIDTDAPDRFNISELPRGDKANSVARFMFDTTDKLSGIDRYEVSLDKETNKIWEDDGAHTFVTPAMTPGTHTITARAFDRAENSVESKATFTIGSLQPPQITEYPKSVIVGDSIIIIKGVTSPYSDVTIWCEGVADSVFANNKIDVAATTINSVKNYLDRHSHIVRADKDGVFVLEHPKIDIPGVYTAWAEVVDANGEKSTPSDKIVIKVNRAGSPLFSGAGAGGTLIFIVLLIIAWYVRSTFFLLRNKLHKEVNEAQKASEKAFALLQEEVTEHIKEIEKAKENRVLTKEEEKALKRFKKNLKDAEKFVKKEIDDIEDLLV